MSLYNELPIAFPWYEKQEQQDRYRENTQGLCTYQLISPKNSLLPFQFRKASGGNTPTTWEIFEANTLTSMGDISGSIPLIRMSFVGDQDYFTFGGDPIPGLNLPAGYYFSILTFPSSVQVFSEVFFVPPVGAFNVEADAVIDFLKLTWYDLKDINPIYYNEEGPDGLPYFKNVAYLDSFVTSSEPQIIEDGTKDGNDELIPTFQKAIINYRISAPMAEFLKKAVALIQMHDFVTLTTQRGIRSGELQKALVNAELSDNGGMSFVDIIFQETVAMVKKGCNDNLQRPGCPGSPTRFDTIGNGIPTSYFLFTGYAPPGTVVQFYGSATLTGLKTLITGAATSAAAFVAGVQFPKSMFDDYEFISAKATATGCDYGFSVALDKIFIQPVRLTMVFDDIANVPVGDPESLSDWNTFFSTSSLADADFATVEVVGNTVNLDGPRNLNLNTFLFSTNAHLVKILDPFGIIKAIGSNCFYQCPILSDIQFPGVTRLDGSNIFTECASLREAVFPACTDLVSGIHFYHCVSLTKADFPVATSCPQLMFYVCPLLAFINFPQATSIGDFAFSLCAAVSVSFPLATSIGQAALGGSPNLKSVNLPLCLTVGDSCFRPLLALETLNLPVCTNIGATTGNDLVFDLTIGRTIHLTLKTGTETDGDVVYLQANNTVTLTLV